MEIQPRILAWNNAHVMKHSDLTFVLQIHSWYLLWPHFKSSAYIFQMGRNRRHRRKITGVMALLARSTWWPSRSAIEVLGPRTECFNSLHQSEKRGTPVSRRKQWNWSRFLASPFYGVSFLPTCPACASGSEREFSRG
jgi:hypothetical protein